MSVVVAYTSWASWITMARMMHIGSDEFHTGCSYKTQTTQHPYSLHRSSLFGGYLIGSLVYYWLKLQKGITMETLGI